MIKNIFLKIFKGIVLFFSLILFPFTKKEKTLKNETKKEEKKELPKTARKEKTILDETDEDSGEEKILLNETGTKKENKKIIIVEIEKLGISIFNDEENIVIRDVHKGSVASSKGLQKGDIITKINDKKIKGESALNVLKIVSNEEIKTLEFKRENEKHKISFDMIKEENIEDKKTENDFVVEENEFFEEKVLKPEKQIIENDLVLETEKHFEKNIVVPLNKDVLIPAIIPKLPSLKKVPNNKNNLETKKEIGIKKSDANLKENKQNKKKKEISKKNENVKKKNKEILSNEEECFLIAKIIENDRKEKEIIKVYDEKKEILSLLKSNEKYQIKLFPFIFFNRRMVRNVYKNYLLSNSLVKIRKILGDEYINYHSVNHFDLLNKRKRLSLFENLTFDNLYNIDMIRMELKKKYKNKDDFLFKEIIKRLDFYEKRQIARYQRLILKKREREKVLVKK